MNNTTFSETTAIDAAVAIATGSDTAQRLLLIPLSQLRPSNRNVRKSGGTSIPELAASIARVGLLQNLTVVAAPDGEHYEVVAGRRRLAALKLLVKRRKLAKDHEVHCLLVQDDAARTVSLTENVQREAMSPIEELFAWKDLLAEGRPLEDIAADFGVTPLVVQRRLRLANVSPRLLADFGNQAVTLEQLMALAITDDHAAQEAEHEHSAHADDPAWVPGAGDGEQGSGVAAVPAIDFQTGRGAMSKGTSRLSLGALPWSDAVKLTITLSTELKAQLDAYAEVHRRVHQAPVDSISMIPHMLAAFIARDRVFKAMTRNST